MYSYIYIYIFIFIYIYIYMVGRCVPAFHPQKAQPCVASKIPPHLLRLKELRREGRAQVPEEARAEVRAQAKEELTHLTRHIGSFRFLGVV